MQDDRSKSREITVLAAMCHIFMDHRKGRNDISDDDAFAVLQKLGVAPRLRTGDRGKAHKRLQNPAERKNAKNRVPLWDKARMQHGPESALGVAVAVGDGVVGVEGREGGVEGGDGGECGEDQTSSSSSDSDAVGAEGFCDEPAPVDDDDAKLNAELDAAQFVYALEMMERGGLGMHLDPLKVCNVCNLPIGRHPRAVSATQCPVCKHWTHDEFCFAVDNETCRKCFLP